MNVLLWFFQGVLAIKLFTVTYQHGLRQDLSTMQEAISSMGGSSRFFLYGGAVLSFLAGMAIIVPGLIHWWPDLVPATSLACALLLLAGVVFHLISREDPRLYVSLILFLISVFVAYSRWQLVPCR